MSNRSQFNLISNGIFITFLVILSPIIIITYTIKFIIWARALYINYKNKNHYTIVSYRTSDQSENAIPLTRIYKTSDFIRLSISKKINIIFIEGGFKHKIKKIMNNNKLQETSLLLNNNSHGDMFYCITYHSNDNSNSYCIRILTRGEFEEIDFSNLYLNVKFSGDINQITKHLNETFTHDNNKIKLETLYFYEG